MADCIPIQYAPARASTRVTIHPTVTEQNTNTANVDAIRDVLLAAGWTLTGNIKATGSVFYIIPVPTFGSGRVMTVLGWLGFFYVLYDTSAPVTVPTGPEVSLVPAGATQDDSFRALCAAASSIDYVWTYNPSGTLGLPTITVHAQNDGTAGNGHPINGILGASGFSGNGGWILTSAAANGVSPITMTVYGGGGNGAGVWFSFALNGHTTAANALSQLFFAQSFDVCASSYQVVFFLVGDQTHGAYFIASAPYIVPDFVAPLGYTAFIASGSNAVLGDPMGYNAPLAAGGSTVLTDGTYRTSATVNALLRRYQSSDPLTTSFGKPLAYQSYLMLPMAGGEMAYVGSIWDVFVEAVERTPELNRIEYGGVNWRVLFTQGGDNGGFNHRTTGTAWLAIGDPI